MILNKDVLDLKETDGKLKIMLRITELLDDPIQVLYMCFPMMQFNHMTS